MTIPKNKMLIETRIDSFWINLKIRWSEFVKSVIFVSKTQI